MSKNPLLYCFVGGALVGAAAALLFAPEKGSELRRKIKETLQKKGILCTESEIDALVAQLTADIDE
ncbi:MAG: YtxH domain-containing protein [Bacteroides sp.]|nr:YtxH domain-containing protein [Bacteroides sp.]MCM1414200.1 YtxH domain-containing protein [Bacteroides sp.]MCM1472022.1 YtxH domain-containing protein [Bacteroides sp.]